MAPETEETRLRCLEALALLARQYQQAAQPFIDILLQIEACRPPAPRFLDIETARLRGFL
jgi:hypothetical protein